MDDKLSLNTAVMQILHDLADGATRYVPRLVTAVVVFVLGLAIAKLMEVGLRSVLSRVKFDTLLEKVGINDSLRRLGVKEPPSRLIPRIFFFLFLFLFIQSAARQIGFGGLADAITAVFTFLPNLLSAMVVLLFGNSLGQFIGRAITASARESGIGYAKSLGGLVSGLILVVVVIMALSQLKFETSLINTITVVMFGGFALGTALTFGLGTREATRNIIAGFHARKVLRAGREVEVDGEKGTLEAVTTVQTLIHVKGRTVAVPNSRMVEGMIKVSDE